MPDRDQGTNGWNILTVTPAGTNFPKTMYIGLSTVAHNSDLNSPKGRFDKLHNLTLACAQMDEYFDMLEREKRRAWRKYAMLVMTGLEFNIPGLTRKTSGNLLALDLQAPIAPSLEIAEIIAQIHSQNALAIASQPHPGSNAWGKNTLFFWEHFQLYAPLLDAWEVANRLGVFTPAGVRRPDFIANSDFHKTKHIYSWKTWLRCDLDREAIKDCIRQNENIRIGFYKDGMNGDLLPAADVMVPALSFSKDGRPAKPQSLRPGTSA